MSHKQGCYELIHGGAHSMKDQQGTVGKKNSTTSRSVENDSWKLFTRVPWDKSLLPPISRNFVPSLPAAFFLSIPIHGLFSSCLELGKSICSSGFNFLIHEKTKTGEKTTHASCFQCSPPARITLREGSPSERLCLLYLNTCLKAQQSEY